MRCAAPARGEVTVATVTAGIRGTDLLAARRSTIEAD
jgi:threonine dehydrogenase-like Zn-dependent dehydrogenase